MEKGAWRGFMDGKRTAEIRETIEQGRAVLGIELGSTRIKAVLIDETNAPVASGSSAWENRLEDGIWTYTLEEVWAGIQASYAALVDEVQTRYGVGIRRLGAIGFSAMMHGYMAFDVREQLLVPFRTWRNTITEEAAGILTETFQFPIPQRWSVAHLYQAILNQEAHVKDICYLTTLAGYVHWKLTGSFVLGIGDASGMFPIDSERKQYDETMLAAFDALTERAGIHWKLQAVLPEVLCAGEAAGALTEAGARLLDPKGNLEAGVPLCPPEGDAGTGMTATNSVAVRKGNVSAGTSVFAMVVLEHSLARLHPELDMVTTPDGHPVAMVHCNNCTSDLNAWVGLFSEFAAGLGMPVDQNALFQYLYQKALEGEADCGGLLAYNYFSGEHITGFAEGRPLFVRKPESHFQLANFMRVHLYTALGALKTGMDILLKEEGVALDEMIGHGGLFKTPLVGQKIMAAALNTPVALMETAGEGGAWGIALLASYMCDSGDAQTLDDFLASRVFGTAQAVRVEPEAADVEGFERFMARYRGGLDIQRAAVEHLR